jgi:membrane associated rhomboid family serine protease
MATCYRHPGRETGVSCSNCGNPICPDCMTSTPVGMRCPDCSKQRTPVRTMRSITVDPIATYVLMALNIAVFIGVGSSGTVDNYSLFASECCINGQYVGVGEGEWWRLVTSGFLHEQLWHIGFNMLALLWLGRMIEPALGHARFVGIYMASLFTGSLAVLLIAPDSPTLGASGAVYGLLGAAVVMARNRQIDLMQSGLIPIIALNFVITLLFGFSFAAHFGGLVGGLVVTFVVEELAKRRRQSVVPAVAFCAFVSVAAIAGSLASVA